jgi:hypothetical protein
MSQINGGCLCGKIRYEFNEQPVVVAICHYTNCQKQSGSAFSVNLGLPKDSLKFTSGETSVYQDKGDSGMPVYRHFCSSCGSPIYSDAAAVPQLDFLKSGSLDDVSWVKPSLSIWCESSLGWVVDPSNIARFPQSPPAV